MILLLVPLLALLAFLYAGLASAVPGLDPVRLRYQARKGDRRARQLLACRQNAGEYGMALSLAAALCSAGALAILFWQAEQRLDPGAAWIAAAIYVPVQALLIDLGARQIFRRRPAVGLAGLWVMVAAARSLLSPVVRPLAGMLDKTASVPLSRPDAGEELLSVARLIPTVSPLEMRMIEGVLRFRSLRAADLAVSLRDLPTVEAEATLAEVVSRPGMLDRRHVVVMAADGRPLGAMNPGDALRSGATSARVQSFARPLLSMAGDLPAWDVLIKLRRGQTPVGIVHDESGEAILGVVTEDLVVARLLGQ